MGSEQERQYVTANELVEHLTDAAGARIKIERNGGASIAGDLISAALGSVAVDGVDYPVAHLVLRRPTRDGTTPVMVSLITGVAPDEDFFWPDCPVVVHNATGVERLVLRSALLGTM